MDFSIVKKAGLSQREFAELCGVSRETANMWCKGKWQPHRLHANAIESQLVDLRAAVRMGHLPLPRGARSATERDAAIKVAMYKTAAADLGP